MAVIRAPPRPEIARCNVVVQNLHNKLVIADDIVVTGSFNLSNHAMGNAENVVLIRSEELARRCAEYLERLIVIYTAANGSSTTRVPAEN